MEPGSGHQSCGSGDDDGRALHARLLRRDPTAPPDLANRYLEGLVVSLRRSFIRDRFDDDLLMTVAIELILDFGARPEQFDPDRLGLRAYLLMAAKRDVLNALQSERRRADRHVSLDDVELRSPARNRQWASATDPADTVVKALDDEQAAAVREHFMGRDREIVDLMWDGERRTEVFADVLGLQGRPWEEQVREVKRVKDRLKKRMQRLWRRMSGDE
jgi:hypothetical protein